MTTKVRIVNVTDYGACSNGDVIIDGPNGRIILAPGGSHEEWLKHGDPATPLVIVERWPSKGV